MRLTTSRLSNRTIPVIGIALFWGLGVQASPAVDISGYCPLAQSLQPAVVNCETNYLAVEATTNCINGLLNSINIAQAKLASAMEQTGKSASASQQGDLQNTGADLAMTRTTLAALVQEATSVRQQLTLYLKVVSYPGGISRAQAKLYGVDDVYSSFPCFKSAEDAVMAGALAVDKKIDQLKSTEGAAAGVQSRSDLSLRVLTSFSGAGSASRVMAPGFTDREQNNPQSNITGSIQEADRAVTQRSPASFSKSGSGSSHSDITSGEHGLFSDTLASQPSEAASGVNQQNRRERALSNAEAAVKDLLNTIPRQVVSAKTEPGIEDASANGSASVGSTAAPDLSTSREIFPGGAMQESGGSLSSSLAGRTEGAGLFERVHLAYDRAAARGSIH